VVQRSTFVGFAASAEAARRTFLYVGHDRRVMLQTRGSSTEEYGKLEGIEDATSGRLP